MFEGLKETQITLSFPEKSTISDFKKLFALISSTISDFKKNWEECVEQNHNYYSRFYKKLETASSSRSFLTFNQMLVAKVLQSFLDGIPR